MLIDPQGEFAKDIQGQPTGEFQLPLANILEQQGKKTAVLSVRNLVLDTWELLSKYYMNHPSLKAKHSKR